MHSDKEIYDDEIDLVELVKIIWQRKVFIIIFVMSVSLLTVFYTLYLDNVYESRAVLKPTETNSGYTMGGLGGFASLAGFAGVNISSGDSVYADINVLLKDQRFIAEFIKKNKFELKLVDDTSVLETPEFKSSEVLNLYRMINGRLIVSQDKSTGYITAAFRDTNPAFAKEFVDAFLIEISSVMKQKQMANIDKRIENYKLEIDKAADLTLKNKLSELVVNLIQSKVLANADEYYGFSVISEPFQPDLKDKVAPKRSQMCIIAFVTSFVFSLFAVLFMDYFKNNIKKLQIQKPRLKGTEEA